MKNVGRARIAVVRPSTIRASSSNSTKLDLAKCGSENITQVVRSADILQNAPTISARTMDNFVSLMDNIVKLPEDDDHNASDSVHHPSVDEMFLSIAFISDIGWTRKLLKWFAGGYERTHRYAAYVFGSAVEKEKRASCVR